MSKSALEFSFLKKQSFQLFLIVLVPIVFVIAAYSYGWYQSRFKCLNFVQPLIYPFIAAEQVNGCMVFSDLNNYRADITNKQLNEIIKIMAKTGRDINPDEAYRYAFGRAKIEEYARRNSISVSEEEVTMEFEKQKKELGGDARLLGNKTEEEKRAEIRGFLLQNKAEKNLVVFKIADWVALRWDWKRDEEWQPKINELREEAKQNLNLIKDQLSNGVEVNEAAKKGNVDETKMGFNIGKNERLSFNPKDAEAYRKGVTLPKGVSEAICDDRFCVVFRILDGNDGKYASMEDFLGELKAW